MLLAAPLAVLACREAAGPRAQPQATLTLGGPAAVAGETTNPDGAAPAVRYQHTCVYRVEAQAVGGTGATARWTGARWTITEPLGLGVTPFQLSGALSAAEVEAAFGRTTVTPDAPARAVLTTYVTFAAGPEPRGAVGAHRAHWEFDYEAAGHTRTTSYEVACTPMVVEALLRLRDARTGAGAPFADVDVGGAVWRSDETGVVRPRLAVGRYTYAVRPPRYAPTTGTLLVDNNERALEVVRRAPEVEPGGFEAPCDASGQCAPRVTAYDPAGAAGLPDQLTLEAGGGVPGRVSTASEVLDAYRRRYTFAPGFYGPGVAGVPFAVANAGGVVTRYVCELFSAWRCRETPP